jgi:hypothetical protein
MITNMKNLRTRRRRVNDTFDPNEEFRTIPLPGWERYQVGSNRTIRYCFNGIQRKLKPVKSPSERYPSVCRKIAGANKVARLRVHIAVCTAFHGPRPSPRALVEHRDDDPMNWKPGNLFWSNHRGNFRRAQQRGTVPGIGLEAAAALRAEFVPIRGRLKMLRDKFGISYGCVSKILRGVSYPELGGCVAGYRAGRGT